MKTKSVLFLLLALLTLVACNPKPAPDKDMALVDSLTNVVNEAWNSKDIDKLVGIYADDIVFISGTEKYATKDTVMKVFAANIIPNMTNFKMVPGFCKVTSDMVFIEGLFTFEWRVPDYTALAKGRMLGIWKKQADGSWKLTYAEEQHGDLPLK